MAAKRVIVGAAPTVVSTVWRHDSNAAMGITPNPKTAAVTPKAHVGMRGNILCIHHPRMQTTAFPVRARTRFHMGAHHTAPVGTIVYNSPLKATQ